MAYKKLRHPFNSEIDLKTFKQMFNINGNITNEENKVINVFEIFNPYEPLICNAEYPIQEPYNNYEFLLSMYDLFTFSLQTRLNKTVKINPNELKHYILSQEEYKYFINYYFVSPLETLEDKIKYIESMQTLELPKKYVYNLWEDKEIYNGALKPLDKFILILGLNEKEFYNLFIKDEPLINNYYTKAGLKEIKLLFSELEKIEAYNPFTYSFNCLIDNKIQINCDMYLFLLFVFDKEINSIIYLNPNIKTYKELVNYVIADSKKSLENSKDQEKDFENLLIKSKISFENLQNYILNYYNSNDFNKLCDIHSLQIRIVENIKKQENNTENISNYSDEFNLYNDLSNATLNDLYKYLYYKYLNLLNYKKDIKATQEILEEYEEHFKQINNTESLEHYLQEESTELLKYHRRTETLVNELEAIKQNKTREMANNITASLKFKQWSLGKLIGKSKKTYEEYKKLCDNIDSQILVIKAKLNSINDESLEYDNLRNEKERLEENIKTLKKELLKNHIIEIPYYDNLGKQHKQPMILYYEKENYISNGYKKECIIELTPISIDFKRDDLTISYPFNINYDTFINKKPITQTFSLKDFDSDRFNYLITIILDEISSKPSKDIYINIDEKLLEKLDFTLENKRKAILFIRQHISLLSEIKFKEAKLKLVNSKGKRYSEKTAFTSIIQSGTIVNNILHLVVSDSFFNSIYYYDDKLNSWTLKTSKLYLCKDNGLTPRQNRMVDYSENLVNQSNFESSLISLYSQDSIQNIINYKGKPQAKKEAVNMKNDLARINKNNKINITYEIPKGIERLTDIELIRNTKIKSWHREETPKERHIRESKELKEKKK